MSGTLYLVATPIGNLEDITLRAIRVLRDVDLIACEDTRHTRKLLDHFGIEKPAISYHEHNESARAEELLERLRSGINIALVSDAGTPLISDPGYRIAAGAAAEGIRVIPLPGPSALLAALTASGLPTDAFYFGGFLPPKQMARRRILERASLLSCTVVFYEAPHRIAETLEDVGAIMPGRPLVVCRELTKIHEEFLRGDAATLLRELSARTGVKGEITLVIGKAVNAVVTSEKTLPEAYGELLASGVPRMDAMKTLARERGLSKREVYAALEERAGD